MQHIGFRCGSCGSEVLESTNHCPRCLWSKHLAEGGYSQTLKNCKGLMAPIGLTLGEDQCVLSHQCLACGTESHHRISVNDSFNALVRIPISRNEVQIQTSQEVQNQPAIIS